MIVVNVHLFNMDSGICLFYKTKESFEFGLNIWFQKLSSKSRPPDDVKKVLVGRMIQSQFSHATSISSPLRR
jgi:hypothetical protein